MPRLTTLFKLTSAILLTLLIASCKKSSTSGTVAVVGQNQGFPTLWTNGTPHALSSGFGNAFAIRNINGHQYITGYQIADNGQFQCGYWKDGTFVQLYADPVQIAYIKDLAVSGSDVYAVGSIDSSYYTMAVYWKNGARTTLAGGPDSFFPVAASNGITISNDDVYICGKVVTNTAGITYAVYWKNGVIVPVADSTYFDSYAAGIVVSGGNIYMAGSQYWENGTVTELTNGQSQYGQANAIAVSGADVDIVGVIANNGSAITSAAFWQNGTLNVLPGNPVASANAIAISGGQVYIAGSETNASGFTQAMYWKNLNPVFLPDSTGTSTANGIAIF